MTTMPTDWDPNREGPQDEPDDKSAKAKVTTGVGRPTIYKLKDGTRVPGVTTLLGAFKEPGALMHWAWKLGTEGIDFRKARDDAGDVGHIAHDWIEDTIHGVELREVNCDDDKRRMAMQAHASFLEWRDQKQVRFIDTERPLVSELHRYGGTFDLLATMGSKLVIVDYKSGNKVYREHVAQAAAYRQLLRENTKQQVQGAVLLRIGKEHGTFSDHYYPDTVLEIAWQRFLASKWLFEVDKELGKAASL